MLVIGKRYLVRHDLVDFDPAAFQVGERAAKAVNLRKGALDADLAAK